MAATNGAGLRETVEFTPNVPVEVALLYPTGKAVNGINGQRVMFSLADGRVMFLDLGPAQKINELKPKPREPFFVCKHWTGKKGESPEWTAWLSPEAEKRRAQADARAAGDTWTERKLEDSIEQGRVAKMQVGNQPDGTFVITGAAASTAAPSNAAPKKAAVVPSNGNRTASEEPAQQHFAWAQFLLSQTEALVDVYAAAVAYSSEKYGNTVKPEDVRSLMLSAFTQRAKNGGCDVA